MKLAMGNVMTSVGGGQRRAVDQSSKNTANRNALGDGECRVLRRFFEAYACLMRSGIDEVSYG